MDAKARQFDLFVDQFTEKRLISLTGCPRGVLRFMWDKYSAIEHSPIKKPCVVIFFHRLNSSFSSLSSSSSCFLFSTPVQAEKTQTNALWRQERGFTEKTL